VCVSVWCLCVYAVCVSQCAGIDLDYCDIE